MSFSIYNTETQLEQANSTIRVLHSQLADERKQLAEYKQRAEAAEAKLRELEPVELCREVLVKKASKELFKLQVLLQEGQIVYLKEPYSLYAKLFPKQEDK